MTKTETRGRVEVAPSSCPAPGFCALARWCRRITAHVQGFPPKVTLALFAPNAKIDTKNEAAARDAPSQHPPTSGLVTARELAVIRAIQKGKSNKVIAYELNMCESTVKVHVRNIMKKLKAKNRTEVAINALVAASPLREC